MLVDLLNNLAITAALLFIAGKFFQNRPLNLISSVKTRMYAGIGSGLLGSLLMLSTISVTDTVMMDMRHLAMVVAAIFGGPVSAILSGVIIGLMRVIWFGINSASIVAGVIAISMGFVFGWISTTNMAKGYKYLFMNGAFVLSTSIALYIVIGNPSISVKALFYYIPITMIGGVFTYYMAEYIKRSNEDHRSMTYYKVMADNSSDLLSTHHLDGTFKYLSPSCKGILGYEPKELVGRSPYDFYHPEDIKEVMNSHDTVKSTSEKNIVIYRFKQKNGSYIWIETTSKQILDTMNSRAEIICISRNVTERKIIEDALHESTERYLNLIKHMPDPMVVHKNDKIIFANEQSSEIVNYSTSEVLGKSIYEFIDPSYHEEVANHLKEIYELKSSQKTLEFKIKTSTDQVLDIEATSKLISYNNEDAIQVIYRDVTERKRLERELKETHERFKFIMDNSKDVISILESDGRVRYISPACEMLYGYTPEEFQGKNAFEYIHPEDIGGILDLHQQFQNSEKEFVSFTYRYLIRSNEYIWAESVVKAVRIGERLESILAITRDVTSTKKKALALEKTNKRLLKLSSIDGLTEIPNRRYFDRMLSVEWKHHKREEIPLSIILMDIDFFKKYNDEYGHLQGDDCLRRVAKVFERSLKHPRDFVARFGGEEFVIILPETNEEGAITVAETIRKNILDEKIPHIKSEVLGLCNDKPRMRDSYSCGRKHSRRIC